jgi:murein DD-endopeptidase MepM/ murein hydrolase activator NlpD
MNKSIIIIFLVLISTSLFSQHLFTERSAKRGEILRAYVYPSDGIVNSRFTLISNKGRIVADSSGFNLTVNDSSIETALLGLPSDISPGKYTLKVFCETEQGSDQFVKPFFVSDRDFISMDINLSSDMSNLRSSDDPQKAEQSRKLWSVISSLDKDADYFNTNFKAPVESYIETAYFGDRRNFIYSDGSNNSSLHYGSDFAAPVGEPVYAAGAGKVVMVEERIITGNTVIIEHLPGVYTLYYHMDTLSTEMGMVVEKGAEIGKVGATGLVTGAHLHWELRVAGIAVDPLLYIQSPLIDKDEIMNIITSIH